MKASTVFAILIGLVLAGWLTVGSGYPVRAMLLPYMFLTPVLFLAVAQIVREFRDKESKAIDLGISKGDRRNYIIAVAFIPTSILLTALLGFNIAIPLCTLAIFKLRGEKWRLAIVLSAALTAFTYGMFTLVLRVPPHGGILFQ